MFSSTISNVKILKDSVDTMSQIIDEGLFKIRKSGIELLATDRAMVAVVDFKLDAAAFDEYNCEKESEVGLNMINLLALLKRAGAGDKLKMSLNDNALDIVLEGKSVRKFSMPVLNISSDEIPPVNQLDFNATAELNTSILDQGIADADIIADSVVIEMTAEQMKMIATGDTSKSELTLEKGNESLLTLEVKDEVRSRYPLDYMKKMIKASKIVDKVKLSLGTDYPMKLEFKGDNVALNMVLAPRVSEE